MEDVKVIEIKGSGRIKDVIEISKYFKKYEPEANVAQFLKFVIGGIRNGNVMLLVYYEGEEFKGGVVLTAISPEILKIEFSYVDQHIKGLSEKFMEAVDSIAKKIGVKKIRVKATRHTVAAQIKFGFKEAFTVLEKDVPQEVKQEVKEIKEEPKVETKGG